MNILFVIASLKNGGAERVLQVLANQFARENKVSIAILEVNENFYKFDENINFIYLDVYKSGKKFDKYRKLRACFKAQNPDVIISFMDWTNFACVVANFGLNYKLIATEHNSYDLLDKKLFAFLRNLAYKKVDLLTVLSKSDLLYYSKFVKNCEVIYNPFFGNLTQNTDKENIILSVARLEKVKGFDTMLKALSKIDPKLLKEYKVLIAGDGKERENLENLAKDLNVKVEFLGHVKSVDKLYAKAKIFVLASHSEGLSNVLIESSFYNCARISSDTVGGKELIKDGQNGLLFKIGDFDELAKKLEKLMNSDELIDSLVKNANMSLDEFRVENIYKKWESFINKTVNKPLKKDKK